MDQARTGCPENILAWADLLGPAEGRAGGRRGTVGIE
jgi:hypothetical protein